MKMWPGAELDDGRGKFDAGHGFTYTPYFDGPNDEEWGGIWFWHPCIEIRGPHPGPNGRTGEAWGYSNTEDPAHLTLEGSILCETCGLHGFLRDGVWLPV